MYKRQVNRALEWGDQNGLNFNPSKTEVLLFNRKKEPEFPTKLQMSGKSVDFTDQVRYLGVILDTKLSWKPHIKLKVRNAKAALAKARSSLGQLGGFQAMLSKGYTPESYAQRSPMVRWYGLQVVNPNGLKKNSLG